jgi:hypothetical protein
MLYEIGEKRAVKPIEMAQNAGKESKQKNVTVFETVTKIIAFGKIVFICHIFKC